MSTRKKKKLVIKDQPTIKIFTSENSDKSTEEEPVITSTTKVESKPTGSLKIRDNLLLSQALPTIKESLSPSSSQASSITSSKIKASSSGSEASSSGSETSSSGSEASSVSKAPSPSKMPSVSEASSSGSEASSSGSDASSSGSDASSVSKAPSPSKMLSVSKASSSVSKAPSPSKMPSVSKASSSGSEASSSGSEASSVSKAPPPSKMPSVSKASSSGSEASSSGSEASSSGSEASSVSKAPSPSKMPSVSEASSSRSEASSVSKAPSPSKMPSRSEASSSRSEASSVSKAPSPSKMPSGSEASSSRSEASSSGSEASSSGSEASSVSKAPSPSKMPSRSEASSFRSTSLPSNEISLLVEEDEKTIKDSKIKTKLKKETLAELENRKNIAANENKYSYLYPNFDDPNFNIKIAERKEFYDTRYDGKIYDIEKQAEQLCNADFELAPHQLFVRNFMSSQTPYNSLLLYHGLGSGKTCSAIGVAEEMRDYLNQMGITERIIVVAAPNVQNNFKLQLFDDRKLKLIDGLWNIRSCTGNKYLKEINPMNMKGLSKDKVTKQIRRIINSAYLFLGYTEFANYILKKSTITSDIKDPKRLENLKIQKLKKHFNNRLIIIDEVHNIRKTDDNSNKRIAIELTKLVSSVDFLRLLLLSATPMYNSYKEIIWLINLMNMNDKRSIILEKDVFNKDGTFKTDKEGRLIGQEELERKATGYISFVRGENPYTFPYRIWPSQFSPENTFEVQPSPSLQINNKPLIENLQHLSVYLTDIGEYQQIGYDYIISRLHAGDFNIGRSKQLPSFDNMEAFGYTLLQKPLEALNIIYPDNRLKDKENKFDSKNLVGKTGLNRIMQYTEETNPMARYNFEYKQGDYGNIFSPGEIGKYSGKIKNICNSVINSRGVILIYSQYIDGGLVPIALALEELGFTRAGQTKSLFKTPPTEKIDALTFKTKNIVGDSFNPAKYVMITGDKALSPDNEKDLKLVTNLDNSDGRKVKVVLISQAGSEGLDFKFIRQVHVLEPWYNMSRIEQIIGRAVRNCSHKDLPFIERNVQIYLYGSLMADKEREAADIYVYRLAEMKAIDIGRVSRILKEISVDCLLNFEQTEFTAEKFNQKVKQQLSSGQILDYQVGDKPYSAICDYMESCNYMCKPNKLINSEDVKLDTFSESFIFMNTDKIIQRIRSLMKDQFFYRKKELVSRINVVKEYPLVQINAALNQLVEDESEFITDRYGRLGNLINIGNLYLFQPLELNNDHISVYDRSVPINYKRDKLDFKLTEPMTKILIKPKLVTKKKVEIIDNEVMKQIKLDYFMGSTYQDIKRGEDNWYKFSSLVINNMVEEGVPRDTLLNFLVAHILEELNFDDQLVILNSLDNMPDNDLENRIKNYFNKQILSANNIKGILMQNRGKQQLVVESVKDGKKEWKLGLGEDYNDLAQPIIQMIKRLEPYNQKLNNIIGFMANFKEDYIVFKTKDMTKKRHKGARCDQSGKAEAMKVMNSILGEVKYSPPEKNIGHKQFCVMQEFTLRLFNEENKNGKVWFLNPIEAVLINVAAINF